MLLALQMERCHLQIQHVLIKDYSVSRAIKMAQMYSLGLKQMAYHLIAFKAF